jgi:uncharacterized protein YjaZ
MGKAEDPRLEDALAEIRKTYTSASGDFPGVDPAIYFLRIDASNLHVIRDTFGIQGIASTKNLMFGLHPESFIEGRMSKCFFHEFNHHARLQHFPFFKKGTFLDWMVMEGLAEVYVQEKCPSEPMSPWTSSIDDQMAQDWLAKVSEFWMKKRNDVPNAHEWFFGSETIPKWLGYGLGYRLARSFRQTNLALSWEALIRTPSEDFLPT